MKVLNLSIDWTRAPDCLKSGQGSKQKCPPSSDLLQGLIDCLLKIPIQVNHIRRSRHHLRAPKAAHFTFRVEPLKQLINTCGFKEGLDFDIPIQSWRLQTTLPSLSCVLNSDFPRQLLHPSYGCTELLLHLAIYRLRSAHCSCPPCMNYFSLAVSTAQRHFPGTRVCHHSGAMLLAI
jgi:hypothetical protein